MRTRLARRPGTRRRSLPRAPRRCSPDAPALRLTENLHPIPCPRSAHGLSQDVGLWEPGAGTKRTHASPFPRLCRPGRACGQPRLCGGACQRSPPFSIARSAMRTRLATRTCSGTTICTRPSTSGRQCTRRSTAPCAFTGGLCWPPHLASPPRLLSCRRFRPYLAPLPLIRSSPRPLLTTHLLSPQARDGRPLLGQLRRAAREHRRLGRRPRTAQVQHREEDGVVPALEQQQGAPCGRAGEVRVEREGAR